MIDLRNGDCLEFKKYFSISEQRINDSAAQLNLGGAFFGEVEA